MCGALIGLAFDHSGVSVTWRRCCTPGRWLRPHMRWPFALATFLVLVEADRRNYRPVRPEKG